MLALSRKFPDVEFRRFDPHTRSDAVDCLHITDTPIAIVLKSGRQIDGGRFNDPSSIVAIEMMLGQITDPTKNHSKDRR